MAIGGIFTWFQDWAQVIAGLGSLLLTGGLVYLYWQQHKLLKRELNRDVRHRHTETLRKRIRAWHGDIDELGVGDDAGFFSDETNLPKVWGHSVEPAPSLVDIYGRDTKFRVIPEAIEDDRYMRDLLENHAPELRKLKGRIEQEYHDFQSEKEIFRKEFSDGRKVETDAYTLKPTQRFDEWVFNKAVTLNREHLETDKDGLRSIAENSVDEEGSARPQEAVIHYTADSRGRSKVYTYEAQLKSGDLDDLNQYVDEIEEELLEIYFDAIDDIGEEGVYQHAVEAANILDEMAETIEELKAKLVEFEGHPIYKGDCSYLDEATL